MIGVGVCVARHTEQRNTSLVTRHTSKSYVTRHTSHVTHHTSHITRHTSHVTRHTSHVTRIAGKQQMRLLQFQIKRGNSGMGRHALTCFTSICHESIVTWSHVTRHTSHVTRHTSHVTRHTSHVTHHTSHITHHTSHVTQASAVAFSPLSKQG